MAKSNWIRTTATVTNVEFNGDTDTATWLVAFTFPVGDSRYHNAFTSLKEYAEGESITLQYDPADPSRNTLIQRDKRLLWFRFAMFALAAYVFWKILHTPRP